MRHSLTYAEAATLLDCHVSNVPKLIRRGLLTSHGATWRQGWLVTSVKLMSFSIEQLRTKTDDDIVRLHDQAAENTTVGVSYYLDELRRRETAAAMRASHRLALASFVMTAVSTVTAVVAVVIALTA